MTPALRPLQPAVERALQPFVYNSVHRLVPDTFYVRVDGSATGRRRDRLPLVVCAAIMTGLPLALWLAAIALVRWSWP